MNKLATFRIDETIWEKFKQWAKEKDSSASNELIKHIQVCLADTDSDTAPATNLIIDSRIDEILNRLDALEQRVTGERCSRTRSARPPQEEAEQCIDGEPLPVIDKCIDKVSNSQSATYEKVSATATPVKEADDCIDSEKIPEMVSSNNPFDLNGAVSLRECGCTALLEELKRSDTKRPNKVVAARLNLRGYEPPTGQTKWTAKNVADWMRRGNF